MQAELSRLFTAQAVRHLREDFLPKIHRCLEVLSEEDVWWRPNPASNSVGNLLLHLSGNVRQWIVSGLGGEPDVREREQEFAERGPLPKEELLERLDQTVEKAVSVLQSVPEAELLRTRRIQIYDVTGLQAVFHVVEHFSYHTGQIVYITKLKKGIDLRFYPF